METRTVFQYLSARRYLVDYLAAQKRLNPSFSVRGWSREMGMSSHALLVMMIQGKRSLTLKQVPYLARGLKLSTPERMYFQSLIQYENARSDEERELCRLWMSELNPGKIGSIREVDEFLLIAHWVHMAILSLSQTRDCPNAPEKIAQRLGRRVPPAEVKSAIERLISLGLLKTQGSQLRSTYAQVTTPDDIANRGAREYHRHVTNLALEAIERVSIDHREFQGFSLAMPRSRIALAKELIRKFRTQFCAAVGGSPDENDEVFQMNIQFFQLTECPSEMVPIVDEGAGAVASKRTTA